MKKYLLVFSFLSGITAPGAFAGFDTLHAYGNAAGTVPPPSFTGDGTATTTITAGGADFWGTSDAGAFLWDNTGTYTTTGDFTATVRHVSTSTPAPEWGRDGLDVRSLTGAAVAGVPQADDAHFMVFRKSNGQIDACRRDARAFATDEGLTSGNPGIGGASVATTSHFLGVGRQGNLLLASHALNLGTEAVPVVGRWVEYGIHINATFANGTSVVVGLAHQSHPQTISPDTYDVNTATFGPLDYAANFNPARFGRAAGAGPAATVWSVNGAINVNPIGGAIRGRSFVQVGGVATGEANKWSILAGRKDTFAPAFGAAGAVRRAVASEVADLVQPSRFRRTAALPGLTADIYFGANGGTEAAARAIINAATPPAGTAIIPNVNWTGGSDADTNYGGLTGADSFLVATQPGNPDPASSAAGNFSGNQENYGVHMQGQIFIPGDADRKGHFNNVVLFRDGIDDYTYLNIDGQELLNDNAWTGYNGLDNGGSHVAAMDVSAAKFDDGEWVSFEMIMWEGGVGDNGALYSDMDDTNNSFGGLAPGTYGAQTNLTGSAQVGTEAADGSFGGTLANGQWDVFLTVQNTGTSAAFFQAVTVLPGCNDIVNNNDDSGDGSLRATIANAAAGCSITFAPNVRGAINLTSGELLINKSLTINGPGANLLSVQRSGAAGTLNFRIFKIESPSVMATLTGLTIANGNADPNAGGGIQILGSTVNVHNSTISGNSARFGGGGIYNFQGTVTVTSSTISGNTLSGGNGGGIFNGGFSSATGTLTITSSTISGNDANGEGGGGWGGGINNAGGTVTVTNSTISGNTSQLRGGGINSNSGTLRATNSIIALNTAPAGPDVDGPLTSEGFNLIGNNAGAIIASAPFPDQIGLTASQLNLGPLQDNGGPTQTHALLSGSFAIDKGNSSGSSTDQRGFARRVDNPAIPNATGGDGGDIGAFEFGASAGSLKILSITRSGNGPVVLQVAGFPHGVHRIQASADLSFGSFIDIDTVTTDATGLFLYPAPEAGLTHFYRVAFP